jgi:DNA ligase-1
MAEPNVMLAPNEQIDWNCPHFKFPLFISPKMDGMRVKVMGGSLYSRFHKKLAEPAQKWFAPVAKFAAERGLILDGEIWSETLAFNEIMSAIANPIAVSKLKIGVLDCMPLGDWYQETDQPFLFRTKQAEATVAKFKDSSVYEKQLFYVSQIRCNDVEVARKFHFEYLAQGYEGSVLKYALGNYKHGRATLKQGLMFKFKQWATVDATIFDFKQATAMKSSVMFGERETDEMGYLKRSHKQDTRELVEGIGSIDVKLKDGRIVGVGVAKGVELGITWKNRHRYLGKHVEIIYQDHGIKELPRLGRIVRFRPDLDEE